MQETHREAQTTCKRKGLQLAKINNAEENEYVVRLMNSINKGNCCRVFVEQLMSEKGAIDI